MRHWLSKYYEEAGDECLLVWRKLVRQSAPLPPPLHGEQLQRLELWMLEAAGRRYKTSKAQLVGSVMRANLRENLSELFCSELVAVLLRELGVLAPTTCSRRLKDRRKGAQKTASNYLPCDFSSEERHEGDQLALLEDFQYLRERRVRLLPPTPKVDSSSAVLALSDLQRKRVREQYPDAEPYEALLAEGHLTGARAEWVLRAFLPEDKEARYYVAQAFRSGYHRPFFAVLSLHPLIRLSLSWVMGVDIFSPRWFGRPHREAIELTKGLMTTLGRRARNWCHLTLLHLLRLKKRGSPGFFLSNASAERFSRLVLQEDAWVPEVQLLLLQHAIQVVTDMGVRTGVSFEQLLSAPILSSVAQLEALDDGPRVQAVLRDSLRMDDPLLLIYASLYCLHGFENYLLLLNRQLQTNPHFTKDEKRMLIIHIIILQIVLLELSGVPSLNTFPPSPIDA